MAKELFKKSYLLKNLTQVPYDNLWNTINSGKVWHGEVKNISKTGKIFWCDLIIVPFLDKYGDVHEHKVPCVWQIWKRYPREKIELPLTHPDWNWVKREEADYAIRRVGGLAGKVIKDFEEYATPSHYFITCSVEVSEKLDSLYEKFQEVAKDTAGNPSLGKGEMVRIYNEVH